MRLQPAARPTDVQTMDKRVIWLFVLGGTTVGGFAPEAWGGSAFGLASIALALVGGIAGLWLGARVAA